MMFWTAFLKDDRLMYHRNDFSVALMDADLGELYKRASSPNPSEALILLSHLSLIYTTKLPA